MLLLFFALMMLLYLLFTPIYIAICEYNKDLSYLQNLTVFCFRS